MSKPEYKKLPKSPLTYVLAQVRFNTVLSMADFIPAIQESVRKKYPRFSESVIQNIDLNSNSSGRGAPGIKQYQQWIFSDKENTSGFLLQPNSLVFHTTNYDVFEDYSQKALFVINQVGSIVDLSLVERIGLRYIDTVQAQESAEKLEDYFSAGVEGFPVIKDHVNSKMYEHSEARRRTDHGQLVMKLTKRLGGAPLPPDIGPIDLVVSKKFENDLPLALLDFDHFSADAFDYTDEAIKQKLKDLHDVTSDAFRTVVSDYAIKQWS